MVMELYGINYEQAIEARAKISGLPNLHLLIGKSKDDNLYRVLCLDSGIICISNSDKLDDKTINYLFEEACITALNQFYRAVKKDKKLLLSGRCSNRDYWDAYDELILNVKQKSLETLFEPLKDIEELIKDNKNSYEKGYEDVNRTTEYNDFILAIVAGVVLKNKRSLLSVLYEKETA